MTIIKIIDAPIVDSSPDKLTKHLREVLKRIRMAKHLNESNSGSKQPKANDGHDFEGLDDELDDECGLSYKDERRIVERAIKLQKARFAAAGLSHLKKEEYERLEPLLAGMQIVMPKGADWADQIAANLHEEMPWMAPATEHV